MRHRLRRGAQLLAIAVACSSGIAACGSSAGPSRVTAGPGVCGRRARAPKRYRSVVVFAFENRRWSDVGPGFGPDMPYLHSLGRQCSYFTDWTEADTTQDSLTQYVSQLTGVPEKRTINDCSPSTSCSTTADNLFRQAGRAGRTAINYVEGATEACSASGNVAKHIPALYLWGADDRAHCAGQVRPLAELDPKRLPAFAFVTPTPCDDGHDCSNSVVDEWAATHVQAIIRSPAYRAGDVAVFIWYDEDHPVPNLWIAPSARPGPMSVPGVGYAGELRAWEAMLGLPCLADACDAPDLRTAANV